MACAEKARSAYCVTQAEAFGGGLQEISIARGALRVQLEVLHAAVVQDDDLDVLPADVDDHVRIFVELQRRLGVRDGFHQRDVGVENVFQNVFRVAGGRDAQNFQLGVLRLDLPAQVLEHLDRVLNRIAVRELIGLAEDVAAFVEQHGFGRGRTAIDSDKAGDGRVLLKHRGHEFLAAIGFFEGVEFGAIFDQALAAGLGLFFLAAEVDVVNQVARSRDSSRRNRLPLRPNSTAPSAAKYCAFCGTLIRSSGFAPSGICDFALFPHARNVGLPRLAHAANEAVRPAEQQHMRAQRVAAREHAQVLQHDGFEQRSHQFVGRRADLLQAVDVGLGEYAALPRDFVQLDAVISLLGEFGRWESSAWH